MAMGPKSYIIYEAVQGWRKDWPGSSRSGTHGQVALIFLACVAVCQAKGGRMCGTDDFSGGAFQG